MFMPFSTLKRAILSSVVLLCFGLTVPPCVATDDAAHLTFAQARRITLAQPMPRYPAGARSAGMKGQGIFSLLVSKTTGEVEKVDVYRSTGFRALDIEAIKPAANRRFAKIRVERSFGR